MIDTTSRPHHDRHHFTTIIFETNHDGFLSEDWSSAVAHSTCRNPLVPEAIITRAYHHEVDSKHRQPTFEVHTTSDSASGYNHSICMHLNIYHLMTLTTHINKLADLTTKGRWEKSTLVTVSSMISVPNLTLWARKRSHSSGPRMPSGKPGKFSTSWGE